MHYAKPAAFPNGITIGILEEFCGRLLLPGRNFELLKNLLFWIKLSLSPKADDHGILLEFSRIQIRRINQYLKSIDSQRRTTAAISKWVLLKNCVSGGLPVLKVNQPDLPKSIQSPFLRLIWSFQVNSNTECFYWSTIGLYQFSFTYLNIDMYLLRTFWRRKLCDLEIMLERT